MSSKDLAIKSQIFNFLWKQLSFPGDLSSQATINSFHRRNKTRMHSCSERRMMTVIWSLCLIFCLSNSILVFAKHLCLPDQRDSLWGFKNEFHVPSEKWRNNTDCCSWDGVSCDPKTGNVVGLDLAGSDLNGPLRSNSSLFRLQHLQKLYLGCNT